MEEKGVGVTRELDATVDEFWFAHNFQIGLEVMDQEPVSDNIRISLDIHFVKQLQSKMLAPFIHPGRELLRIGIHGRDTPP